jgi:hypothetical protein
VVRQSLRPSLLEKYRYRFRQEIERQGLFRKRCKPSYSNSMASATILSVNQISTSIVTKVALMPEPVVYILVGIGLLIVWILVRRHKH